MSNPETRLEAPERTAAVCENPSSQSGHFQASGAEMRHMQPSQSMPQEMAADNELLAQMGMAASTRTPEVMAAVGRSSAEADKLFPGKDPSSKDLADSAYRYIMNAEHIDNYEMGSAADVNRLNHNNPETIPKLNAYVQEQFAQGHVPQNDLSQVEAKYPPQPWTGKIVFPKQ